MNDEAHDGGPGSEPVDSVLRPFTPPEPPPLPPVEPSSVVPEPPAAAAAPPEEPAVPPPPPVEALSDDPWSPVADEGPTADVAPETAPVDAGAEPPDEHDEVEPGPEPVAPVAAPGGASPSETITLPRKPFLVGLGVLLAAVALFAALWQTSGDGDADTDVAAPVDDEPIPTEDDAEAAGDVDGTAPGRVVDGTVDDLTDDLAAAQAEIASLEAAVESLEERPPPALDGSLIRRIVVGADAKFVSALPESVAVVGAFGGVSLIDPATNRVVANGNVADAATRVMRTPSSVWLTNYADNQLLRVDPATNTVAATLAFEGPDGIDKDGDTLVVASFDGGFVARVNPNDGAILQQVDVGGKPTDVISHVDHGLWAAIFDTGELVQIDPVTFEVLRRVVVGQGPVGISADPSHLWVSNHDEGTVAKVDPLSGELIFTVAVGNGPTESAVGAGSVWVTVTDDGTLVEIDVSSGEVVSVTPLGGAGAGGGPTGIAFAEGSLWVAMQGEQSVVRIDLL